MACQLRLLLACLALAASVVVPAQGLQAPTGLVPEAVDPEVKVHLLALAGFGTRGEGSVAEALAAEYIVAACSKLGLHSDSQRLLQLEADQSNSRAVTVTFKGRRSDLLSFIVPLDVHVDGPKGEGDAGIALMLVALHDLADRTHAGWEPEIGLAVTFLGGDKRGAYARGDTAGPGTAWWIDSLDAARPTSVVYLTLNALPGTIGLRNAVPGLLSPYWLYERTRAAISSSGLHYELFPNRMQGYRLGLLKRQGPLAPYLSAGIPAVELRTEAVEPRMSDPAIPFTRFVAAMLTANSMGFLDIWDRNYSSFQVGNFALVIREGPYIVFLLAFVGAIAAILIILSVTRRNLLPQLVHKLPHRIGNLAILLLLAGIAFTLSQVCLEVERLVFGSTDAWTSMPGYFVAGRILVVAFSFLSLVSGFVARRWLSPDPWFYEFAALVILGIDVFLFTFLSIPLSAYFCWGFAVALVSVGIRRKLFSIIAIALMYLPFALIAGEMLATPESSALSLLVNPEALSGGILAFVLLPFASLTASPFLFLAPKGERKRKITAFVFLALAILTEGMVIAISDSRLRTSPIEVVENLDQDAGEFTADFHSVYRLGSLGPFRDGIPHPIDSSTGHARTAGLDGSRPITFSSSRKAFLDRVTNVVSIGFPGDPGELGLRLVSDRALTIYDCSLPYHIDLDGKGATLWSGPGRSLPFSFWITTGPDFTAQLSVHATWFGAAPPALEASVKAPALGSGRKGAVRALAEWRLDGDRQLAMAGSTIDATFRLRAAAP
ncbi:MAG: hypothetical protein ACOYM2_07840 [Rectinemataceae bacterium]